jgi:hypothetical protein
MAATTLGVVYMGSVAGNSIVHGKEGTDALLAPLPAMAAGVVCGGLTGWGCGFAAIAIAGGSDPVAPGFSPNSEP